MTLDFSHASKKVLEVIEDCRLHNQREDLFQWVDQFKSKINEGPGGKGKEREAIN